MGNRIYPGVQSAIIENHNRLPVASCAALFMLTHTESGLHFSTGAYPNVPCALVTSKNTINSSVQIETLAYFLLLSSLDRCIFPNQVDVKFRLASDKFHSTLAISYKHAIVRQVHACILLISKYALDSLFALSNFRLVSASLACCRTPGPYVLLKW